MSDSEGDMTEAEMAGWAIPRQPRASASNVEPLLRARKNQLRTRADPDDTPDYQPPESEGPDEGGFSDSNSEGHPTSSPSGEEEDGTLSKPHWKQQLLEANMELDSIPASTQLSDTTLTRLTSSAAPPPHPAVIELAQAVSAFSRAGLQQEADIFRDWTLVSFDMVQYSRALTNMEALPEQTTVEADVVLAEKALMHAETALRQNIVDGVMPEMLRAQIEGYGERKEGGEATEATAVST
ncbi:hypothetical protein LTR36_009915 [Oleoguttula mirabilis]|uniref:Uncharacterized protein n=1 Tax=Oleoguttula mirabilis TaxID=1507867 RepID=A0AAV9J4T1_9PEZI|nr:hypothetical protein LTR36_009915 [Oleoguttula mirabilis]